MLTKAEKAENFCFCLDIDMLSTDCTVWCHCRACLMPLGNVLAAALSAAASKDVAIVKPIREAIIAAVEAGTTTGDAATAAEPQLPGTKVGDSS